MADAGALHRGRRLRRPAIVVVAGAGAMGSALAGQLLPVLPPLTCPTVVSVRGRHPRALDGLIDGSRVRTVADGLELTEAEVWIAPADRDTTVRDGRLRTGRGHGESPSLGALYHSVRTEYGSRALVVVADPEVAGGTRLRLLRDRGACIVWSLELAPPADLPYWSVPEIVENLTTVATGAAADPLQEALA